MSFSYDPYLIVPRDEVRLIMGDTDENDQLFQNEEIDALLTQNDNNKNATCLALAQALVARFARRADIAVGGVRENLSQLVTHYRGLVEMLQQKAIAGNNAALISVHGITEQDAFSTEMFDNSYKNVKESSDVDL